MAFMKNAFIRALNHVYETSFQLQPGDSRVQHFIHYAKSAIELLRVHMEGDCLFFTTCTEGQSLVEALGPTCCPDAEHVIEALVTLSDTLAKWMKNPNSYSADVLRDHLSFGHILVACMHAQIDYLSFHRLSATISDADLRQMIHTNVEWFASNSDISFLLPFVISHHDPSTSSYWPPIRKEGIEALPVLLKAHEDCWQFAPFDPLTKLPTVVH